MLASHDHLLRTPPSSSRAMDHGLKHLFDIVKQGLRISYWLRYHSLLRTFTWRKTPNVAVGNMPEPFLFRSDGSPHEVCDADQQHAVKVAVVAMGYFRLSSGALPTQTAI